MVVHIYPPLWFAVLVVIYHVTMAPALVEASANPCEPCSCSRMGTVHWYIDCSHRIKVCNLTSVPYFPNISENTTRLNLEKCTNLSLKVGSFQKYPNLKILDLRDTSLIEKNLSQGVFQGLGNLQVLDLSDNDQLHLTNDSDPNIFAELASLTHLRMYGTTGTYNQPKGYPETALSKLRSLTELWTDGINATFGPGFREMSNLTVLRISGDYIVPPWRSVEFCELTHITDNTLVNLIHVKRLYIRKCALTHISENAFVKLTKLQYLDLSANMYLQVRNAIKPMSPSVEVLVLNEIEDPSHMPCGVIIDRNMSKPLQNLNVKNISLEFNGINSIEKKVFSMLPDSVEHLFLKGNEFELGFYMFYVFQMKNLKTIDFSLNFFVDDFGIWRRSDNDKPHPVCEELSDDGMSADKHVEPNPNYEFLDPMPNREAERTYEDDNHVIGDDDVTETAAYQLYSDVDRKDADMTDGHSRPVYSYTPLPTSHMYGPLQHHDHGEEEFLCPRAKVHIPSKTLTAYLPPNLTMIDISHSKIAIPIFELFFHEDNNLRELRASKSLLYCWEGPVYGVRKMEIIDLSLNECSQVNPQFFSEFPNLRILNLSMNLLHSVVWHISSHLFQNNTMLTHLNLSFNHIQALWPDFLKHQVNLEVLDLSENGLSNLDLQINHMSHLQLIDLNSNHLFDLSPQMQTDLETVSQSQYLIENNKTLEVDLRQNSIDCSCSSIKFLKWIYKHMDEGQRLRVSVDRCFVDKLPTGAKNITSRGDMTQIIQYLEKQCESYTTLIVVLSLVLAMFLNVIVGVIVHRFRWKILYWYYVVNAEKGADRQGEYTAIGNDITRFRYNVYIASIHSDRDFVLKKLKVQLENKGLKLFIQDVDIVPGQNMYNFIPNAIHVSQMTILVISEHCQRDPEWRIAKHFAEEESIKRGYDMYFGIFMDTPAGNRWSDDVMAIRRCSYLDFPEGESERDVTAFWHECLNKMRGIDNEQIYSIVET